MKNIIVYGAGEFGTLISNVLSYYEEYKIAAFGDDDSKKIGKYIQESPILGQDDLLNFAKENGINIAITAIGNNMVRGDKYNLLKSNDFKMISIVHPKALIDTKVTYGDNVIIEMGTAIHTHSTIGNNVFLGGDALIGHHNTIGNHVLVVGYVSFSDSVIVEDYVSIGVE